MRKSVLISLFIGCAWLAWAQEVPSAVSEEQQPRRAAALTAARADSQFNEAVLHKTVLNYALPEEIERGVKKCTTEDTDMCFIALKAFENHSEPAVAAAANLELAVLAMQRGLIKQALAYDEQAVKLAPEDPFATLTYGWHLLAARKYKKARKVFEDLFYLTADFEYVSSAKLGQALAWYFEGKREKAATQLQYLYTSNPYTISFVSYMLGRIASEMKNSQKMAPVFLQQALSHDEKNYAAAELFAQLSERQKNKLHAWQYYATLYALDPSNKKLAKKVERYIKDWGDKSIDYLYYLRLDQPIVQEIPSTPSPKVRMALYANHHQVPQALLSAGVMGASPMRITDGKSDERLRIAAYAEKHIVFNEETGGVDLKDNKGHVEFSTKRPFTFRTEKANRTLLVRNPLSKNLFATALNDKEIKGTLTVVPSAQGFTLINEVYSEDLVPALLAAQVQTVKEPAAMTALAIVFRSALLEAVAKQPQAPYHITDNDDMFQFQGVNLLFQPLLTASKQSKTLRLTQAQADFYLQCGVVTDDGLENTAQSIGYVFSPANVSKYILSNPPADLYSSPQDPTKWAGIKWIYWLDGKEIQDRLAAANHAVGKLRAIVPTRLTPQGRVLRVRFEGSKGSYEAATPQETAFLLSAGTLRSNMFDIVPFYKGKTLQAILVRGYDTGLGKGLCLQGAQGMAKQGADEMAIIKYYFPNARILDTNTGSIH